MINRLRILMMPASISAICAAMLWLYAGSQTVAAVGSPQANKRLISSAYTPAPGSFERKAIMNALRGEQDVVFKVHYLKVQANWAWVDVTPLDKRGKAVAEGGASLMHKEGSKWQVMDLPRLPEDPDNPLREPTPKFVRQLQQAFPGLPADIFPRPGK